MRHILRLTAVLTTMFFPTPALAGSDGTPCSDGVQLIISYAKEGGSTDGQRTIRSSILRYSAFGGGGTGGVTLYYMVVQQYNPSSKSWVTAVRPDGTRAVKGGNDDSVNSQSASLSFTFVVGTAYRVVVVNQGPEDETLVYDYLRVKPRKDGTFRAQQSTMRQDCLD